MIHSAPICAGGGFAFFFRGRAAPTLTAPHNFFVSHSATFAIRHSAGPSTFSRLGDAGRTGHNLPDDALSQHSAQNRLNGQLANNRLANLANQNWTMRSLHGVGQASVLRNGAFASLA